MGAGASKRGETDERRGDRRDPLGGEHATVCTVVLQSRTRDNLSHVTNQCQLKKFNLKTVFRKLFPPVAQAHGAQEQCDWRESPVPRVGTTEALCF